MTYSVPLHVKIRLTVWDKDEETSFKTHPHIKEEQVYFGDLPLMTENGTVINGTERVIVSHSTDRREFSSRRLRTTHISW